MVASIQEDYNKSWEENECESLKSYVLFWLIWNYIMLSLTGIYYIIFFCSAFCDDLYDEYDFASD